MRSGSTSPIMCAELEEKADIADLFRVNDFRLRKATFSEAFFKMKSNGYEKDKGKITSLLNTLENLQSPGCKPFPEGHETSGVHDQLETPRETESRTRSTIFEQREFFKQILDSCPNFIFVKGRNREIVLANSTLIDNQRIHLLPLKACLLFYIIQQELSFCESRSGAPLAVRFFTDPREDAPESGGKRQSGMIHTKLRSEQ